MVEIHGIYNAEKWFVEFMVMNDYEVLGCRSFN
jgi:hypothetical protein